MYNNIVIIILIVFFIGVVIEIFLKIWIKNKLKNYEGLTTVAIIKKDEDEKNIVRTKS